MLHLVKRYSRKHQLNQYLTSDILTCSLKFDGLADVPPATSAMLAGEQLVAVIDTFAGRLLPAMVHVITVPATGAEQDADCTTTTGPADASQKLLLSTNGAAHPAGLLS